MTVPNQAINDLYQDGMYFQEVKIPTAYQMMTFCLNSLSKGLTSNTNSNSNSNKNSTDKSWNKEQENGISIKKN